ncbi:hypothetical protein GC102_23360 [Paenibacillus sp. LMG 31460]|uniref:Uncharacterized protein n=1 Tax=Paenibacillus germinis TaxID=2654979 RepID=A0ABX1Z5K6_9BACL|nr:hypothetical protein [Paenibacillus germinis]NOU88665.1 hypothetical protein [Paenibacillus germinis]
MFRKDLKYMVSSLLAGVLLGSFAVMAFASTASSGWGTYGPINGYSYQNKATVSNDTRLYAATSVQTQDSSNAPTGYMGAVARLYKSDVLCQSTSYSYNSSSAAGMGTSTTTTGCGSGTYYSYGLSAAYNGNGYNEWYTFQSPNITN